VLDGPVFEAPSTKRGRPLLGRLAGTAPTLIVLTAEEKRRGSRFRNLAAAAAVPVEDAGSPT